MMRKTLSMLFTLAVVVAPAVAHAQKPVRVNSTGVGASIVGPVVDEGGQVCGNCLSLSVEQVTDQSDNTQTTTLSFTYTKYAADHATPVTTINYNRTSASLNVLVTTARGNGDTLTISFLVGQLPRLKGGGNSCSSTEFPDPCSTSPPFSSVSLIFTKNNKSYKFERESSVKGVLRDGTTHMDDKFHETFTGANVGGVLLDASFSSSDGELSTLRGDQLIAPPLP